jgi:uncharacterized repeat protein (TIGR01451 family)
MMITRARLVRALLSFYFLLCALLITHGPTTSTATIPISAAWGAFRSGGLEYSTRARHDDTLAPPANHHTRSDAPPVATRHDTRQPPVSSSSGANSLASAGYDTDSKAADETVSLHADADSGRTSVWADPAGVTNSDLNVHQYFVPFDDRDLMSLLRASNACQGAQQTEPVSNTVASRISLTASSDGTRYYYDHWEDGYDDDPLTPSPTTMIGVLGLGMTRIFTDDVNTADPNWGTTLYQDGGDRITVLGDPASVIRAAYPSLRDSQIGMRLAGAWEVDQTSNWGAEYIFPAGEDWGAGSDFEFTGASLTALLDGTRIFLNGSPLGSPLSAGQVLFVNGADDGPHGGGLDSGDTVTATGPIQVHAYSSICSPGAVWSGNGYTLEPVDDWTSDYYSPVPGRTAGPGCDNSADVDIFLYNNTGAAFSITIDDSTPNTVLLPPGSSSVRALNGGALSNTRGVQISAPGGQPFWGLTNFDTQDVRFEWAFSLIPLDQLSSKVVLGWAPGNGHTPPVAQHPPNGNLVFVMATSDTVVYTDLDQDDNADRIDCNGDGDANDWNVDGICDEPNSDAGITLPQGLTLRIADPVDANMTGAKIYTQDLAEKLAVAWGEDACVARGGRPYMDMGYTVLPVPIPSVAKFEGLAADVDGSGDVSPGDLLTYTVVIKNSGEGPMRNVVLTDRLPFTYTDFVVGSITSTSSPPPLPAPDEDYYDGVAWNYIPAPVGPWGVDPVVQQLRLTWPVIGPGQKVTVSFHVQIQLDVPPGVNQISNTAIVSNPDTPISTRKTTTFIGPPILRLDKLYSGPTTVRPGDLLTYTVIVSNVGTATAANVRVADDLPPWVTYVTDSLNLTWPTAHVITTITPISRVTHLFNDRYGDDFDLIDHVSGSTDYSGSDGTLSWLNNWIEINDDDAPGSGDISVLSNAANANSPHGYMQIGDADDSDSGLRRCVALSGFIEPHLNYRVAGVATNAQIDDYYRVVVTSTSTIITIAERFNAPAYEPRDLDLSDLAGQSPVCMTFFAQAGMDGSDQYRIDDVYVYDALRDRTEPVNLIQTTTVVSYTTLANINPLVYTRIPPAPDTVAITHTMVFTHPFSLPPQSRFTATFQVRLGFPLTDGLQILNTACVTATNLTTQPYPLCDTTDPTVYSDHVLTITKSHDPICRGIGDPLTYNMFWEVAGDEPAPGVVVTDVLPLSYFSFDSCAGGLSCDETSPGLVTWELGDRLPPMSGITQDSGWLTLTVRVAARPPGGVVTNTVIIDDATDTPPDRDDEQTIIPDYSFDLTKQRIRPISSTAKISDTIVFQITITNTGLLSVTHLPLKDAYDPLYLQRESVVPPPDSVSNTVSQTVLLWDDLTSLAPDGVLLPGLTTQVVLTFTAIHTTTDLPNGVTINTAVSEGAEAGSGQLLCRLEDSDFAVIEITTAIELLYFRAGPRAGGVWVEWATLLEIDTYGFWLYRSTDTDVSHSVPVAFVPARGWGSLGAPYDYLDTDLPPGKYYYWLVEVENSGKQTIYGPINASPGWDTTDLPYHIYLPLIQRP